MLFPLAAGLASSALLLFVSALFSPEWPRRKEIRKARALSGRPPEGGVHFSLGVFGIAVGLPAALGFVDGNVFLVLGGLIATLVGRAPAPSGRVEGVVPSRPAVESPWPWFVVFAWAVFAGSLSVDSLDLGEVLAAQAVFGPVIVAQDVLLSAILALGFLAGILGALFFVRRATAPPPASAGSEAEALLAWGRCALTGSALTAVFFGPSLGSLMTGPAHIALRRGAAGSFLLSCMIVAALASSRRMGPLPGPRAVLLFAGGSALAALVAGALLR